jgi:hypothetical protein
MVTSTPALCAGHALTERIVETTSQHHVELGLRGPVAVRGRPDIRRGRSDGGLSVNGREHEAAAQ